METHLVKHVFHIVAILQHEVVVRAIRQLGSLDFPRARPCYHNLLVFSRYLNGSFIFGLANARTIEIKAVEVTILLAKAWLGT